MWLSFFFATKMARSRFSGGTDDVISASASNFSIQFHCVNIQVIHFQTVWEGSRDGRSPAFRAEPEPDPDPSAWLRHCVNRTAVKMTVTMRLWSAESWPEHFASGPLLSHIPAVWVSLLLLKKKNEESVCETSHSDSGTSCSAGSAWVNVYNLLTP